jgi:hypothetical protein
METSIKKNQTAIFIKNLNLSNDLERAGFFTEMHEKLGEIFNGQPTQLPIPNDAPPEIPRFMLSSMDGKFTCNISLSRVDIFCNIPNLELDLLFEEQKNNIQVVFNFLSSKKIIVNRIGFIAVIEKILTQEEGDSLTYLKKNFVRDSRFKDPKELMFRYNKADNSENFEMNKLIVINSNINKKSIINLQTDINTLAERMGDSSFNSEDINEIVNYSTSKTKEIINNFPNI